MSTGEKIPRENPDQSQPPTRAEKTKFITDSEITCK